MIVERPSKHVLALWLDRAERRNALDLDAVEELLDAFGGEAASRAPPAAPEGEPPRAVVLGSADPRCFCAGADLGLPDRERAELSDRLYELYRRMLAFPAPIVAAIGGPAIGGGAQLAIASDLRIAGRDAFLRFVGPGHGLAVGAWGLPSLVGRGRATDLCLSMRPVLAGEALEIGLVDRVEDDPNAAALALAAALVELDETAARRVKQVIRVACGTIHALELERRENRASWSGSAAGLTAHTGRDREAP